MKLIVGLGNIGDQYKNTRHNVGFKFIDYYLTQNKITLTQNKFNGLYAKTKINNIDVIIAKPTTYMNLSGEFVYQIIHYYNINIDDIIVIYDDINYDVGTFKIKQFGSSGGQNGIKNIIKLLGTEKINRIKIGIGKPNIPLQNYVLSKFDKFDNEKLENIFIKILDAIDLFINDKINIAMNRYN